MNGPRNGKISPVVIGAIVVLILLIGFGIWRFRGEQIPVENLPDAAQAAFKEGNWERAEELAKQYLAHHPKSIEMLDLAAQAAFEQNNIPFMMKYYSQIPDDRSEESNKMMARYARTLLDAGWLTEAEARLRKVLEKQPDNVDAHEDLIYLLRVEGRNRECLPSIERIWDLRGPQLQLLFITGWSDWLWLGEEDRKYLQECQNQVPDDPIPSLGLALKWITENKFGDAVGPLFQVVSTYPNNLYAQGRLGEMLFQLNRDNDFLMWHKRLPDNADESELVWFVRGLWAESNNQQDAAIRCFAETLVRDHNHRKACYHLAQLLISKDQADAAKPFSERADLLLLLEDNFMFDSSQEDRVSLLEKLGRYREASAWIERWFKNDKTPEWAETAQESLKEKLTTDNSMLGIASNPVTKFDYSELPLPKFPEPSETTKSSSDAVANSTIHFVDESIKAKLLFIFRNGASEEARRAFIFEFSGGGVAVLDYDLDGWPDLNLTQGSDYPFDPNQTTYLDRLFRNIDGERFKSVTKQSGLGDALYSQGATVGDFNSDGFPDLYLANIGQNRLYLNNGDGTFEDVTAESGIAGEVWTVSCVMVDLNNDSLPDLYNVNYVKGEDLFTRVCPEKYGPVQCPINFFEAEQDRLYVNLGDGRFQDVTESSGIVLPDGKGMGIVAADLDGSGRMGLFVANDTKPNYLFQNTTKDPGGDILLEDIALISGIARNGSGDTESSMGVAAGDYNGDARLDFLVTNYYQETNTFHRQRDDGVFEDYTQRVNLGLSSLSMLGWGTQFLDADLDGLPDLIVANGHLDDYLWNQIPFKMRTQVYKNIDGERFEELEQSSLGGYFKDVYQGRTIARLDWNGDGREDACVTHVEAPVALLTNQTTDAGNFCAVRLVAVNSARDAIGTRVRVVTDEKSYQRQLVAGDGFEASNERQLVFGLGKADAIKEIQVQWPSGEKQTFATPPINKHLLMVEGRGTPVID